jgi:hypothetical protein
MIGEYLRVEAFLKRRSRAVEPSMSVKRKVKVSTDTA